MHDDYQRGVVTVKETTKFFGNLGIGILCAIIIIASIVTVSIELFMVALGIVLVRIGLPPIYHDVHEMFVAAQQSDERMEESAIDNRIIRFRPRYECYLALDEFESEDGHHEC